MNSGRVLDIVIPMAGRGSRFVRAGFGLPKPLIDVNGKPMIQRVIENLTPRFEHRFIFLVLAEHLKQHGLETKLKAWAGPTSEIVSIDRVTEGAACTVLLAEHHLRRDHDMVIANSDQLVDVDFSEYVSDSRERSCDGNIMVFEDDDEKWSFARINDQGLVTEVAEKKRISNLATVGIYYFREGAEFALRAREMIAKNIRVNHEFYVCPVYNELIRAGRRILVWKVNKSAMHGVGTPEDLAVYLRRCG